MRTWISLAFFLFGLAACDPPEKDLRSHFGDGGTCSRNPAILDDLIVHPQACTTTAACPVGSFCRAETGVCDWSCLSDSDCGLGTCDCDGVCQAVGQADAGIASDPVCPRNQARLDELNLWPHQVCTLDEDCPNGSHCSDGRGYCEWECLPEGALACAAGTVCDCSGRCETPGAGPATPPVRQYRFEMSTHMLWVPAGSATSPWPQRRLQVTMVAPDLATLASLGVNQYAPALLATPTHGVQVFCGEGPITEWRASCALAEWSFPPGSTRSQPKSVWISAGLGFTGGNQWQLVVDSIQPDGPGRQVAQIARVGTGDGAPSPQPLAGEYAGELRLVDVTGATPGAIGSPSALRLPVRAWMPAGGTGLEIYDGLRVLTPSGKLRLPAPAAAARFVWLEPGGDVSGRITAEVTADAAVHTAVVGTLNGELRVRVGLAGGSATTSTWRWRYQLRRVGAATTCGAGAPACGPSLTCAAELGVCTEGPAWTPTADAGSGLFQGAADTWSGALATMSQFTFGGPELSVQLTEGISIRYLFAGFRALFSADFYDGQHGVSSVLPGQHRAVANAHLLADPPPPLFPLPCFPASQCAQLLTRGLDACRASFAPYDQWIPTQSASGQPFQVSHFRWDGSTSSAPLCDQLYATADAIARDRLVPCVPEVPEAWDVNNGLYTLLSAQPGAKRASCQALHVNHRAALGASVPADFATFLSTSCKLAAPVDFRLTRSGTTDVHLIYLCPYRAALLGPQDAATSAERLMCYAPGSTWPFLVSSTFGTQVMPISGDLRCTSGVAPHGIELASAADRGETMGLAGLAAACLEELVAAPAALADLTTENGQVSSYVAHFATGRCFSPGHFYPALTALIGGSDDRAGRLLQRLLQQWLELHGFLAKEGAQENLLVAALRAAPTMDLPAAPARAAADATAAPETILAQVERGWNVVLDARVTARLLMLPAEVLRNPDYRPASLPALPHQAQRIGLPVSLLETATLHLELARRDLGDAQLVAYGQCRNDGTSSVADAVLARSGRALRYTLAAETLAEALRARAVTAGVLAWAVRFDGARAQLEAVRARVVRLAAAVRACENPMGIDDGQVPSYFGDVVGVSSRFFAASDYLMNGWATPAVQSARGALADARSAWLSQRDSRIQQDQNDQEVERRRENLAASYGRELVTLCGLEDVESKDALDRFGDAAGQLDAETCYSERVRPECTGGANQAYALLTDEQLQFHLCAWGKFKFTPQSRLLPEVLWPVAGATNATVDHATNEYVVTPPSGALSRRPLGELYLVAERLGRFDELYDDAAAACASEARFGGRDLHELPEPATTDPSCFHGAMGESVLAVATASSDIDGANQRWDNAQQGYEIDFAHCVDVQRTLGNVDALNAQHTAHVFALRKARLRAQRKANQRRHQSSWFTFNPLNLVAKVAEYWDAEDGITLTSATDLENEALKLSADMENAEAQHQATVQQMSNDLAVRACWSEVNKSYLAIPAAARDVDSASRRADQAVANLANQKLRVRQILREGRAAVAREAGRKVPSLAFHYWLDERLDRYHDEMEWARKLTYLAVLAVEYEFQASLDLHDDVLAAVHPDQLEDVVRILDQERLSRTINTRRPEERTAVLSLRQDVLGLADLRAARPGDRTWSSVRRFQERLWEPDYAVYDEHGQYVGQGIPFTLGEQGALQDRCAERLWRVTATVQGDVGNTSAPTVEIKLIRRNGFSSQWCEGHGDDSAYQSATLLPPGQLFHPDDHGGSEAAAPGFVTAAIQPYLNIPRSQFYSQAFVEGSSEAFAGYGLYGEYVLLFPWHGLLEPDEQTFESFPLERIEDVLIRFDYLSVDDLEL